MHDWKSCVPPKAGPRVRIPLSPPERPGNGSQIKADLQDRKRYNKASELAKRGWVFDLGLTVL